MSTSDPTAVNALARGGVFQENVRGFVPRAAQCEMASAVTDALTHRGVLVAESGTGTGKTFAYLAPIVAGGHRTIISTGTKHLQEQIFHRDLPQVGAALGRPVDAVLLKGRANYLCRHRLNQQTAHGNLLNEANEDAEAVDMRAIEKWSAITDSGDIAEVTEVSEASPLWRQVTSTTDNCVGGQCPEYKNCFVVKARERAMKADIVVVNHHLFFSDLTLKLEGFGKLLPQHDAVVFDEAQSIAEVASNFFGFTLSTGQLTDLQQDIAAAERDEKSGVDFSAAMKTLNAALKKVTTAVKSFAEQSVDFEKLQSEKFDAACNALADALELLQQCLATAAATGDGLRRCLERCLTCQENFDTWLHDRDSNLIRWAAVGKRRIRFHGTPLKISDRFTEMMSAQTGESPKRAAWIFTSATLAVGDDFAAFCTRLGLHDADTRRWESPYDFPNNALMFLPPDMPEPRDGGYADALVAVIAETIAASRGRAFCLFTSYDMMNRVYKKMCDTSEWKILLQGDAPKSELLNRFTSSPQAVLFGTASFWEGVDVVGEKLSCVIIDKLPFAPPTDPVLKNRLLACEADGENPFMQIQIPEAVIALKQGAGRLIRSETDRGVLVLCDPRLLSKPYGKRFLNSLPQMPRTHAVGEVRKFFADA